MNAAEDPRDGHGGPNGRSREAEVLEALVAEAVVGIALLDPELRVVRINAALAAMNGGTVQDHLGRTLREAFAEVADAVEPEVLDVLHTGRARRDIVIPGGVSRPGGPREFVASLYRVAAGDGVVGVGAMVQEITAARRSESRLRQLIDSLFSFVGLLTPDGTVVEANRTALDAAGLDPSDVLGRRFEDTYWWSHDPALQARLLTALERAAAGETIRFDAEVRVKDDRRATIDFSLVPVVEDNGVVAIVPSGIDITERVRDTALLEAAARLTRALSASTSSGEVAQTILGLGPQAFGADFVNVGAVEADQLHLLEPDDLDPGMAERYETLPLDAPTIITDCVTTGELTELHGPEDADGRYRDLYRDVSAAGLSSVAGVPLLRSDGTIIGALGVGWRSPTPIGSAMRARLSTVGQACAHALSRAQRSDARRELIGLLQQELLPRVEVDPPLAVAVRYLPATGELGFGGDWYDLIDLGSGRMMVVVGDVVGHGVGAAARMAQVRSALASLVADEVDLSRLPSRCTEVLRRLTGDHGFIATAAMVLLDARAGTLQAISAGHPPPLLRRADGSIARLDGISLPPLGILADRVAPRTEDFGPGDALLAYTDGLVERRDAVIDKGISELEHLLRRAPEVLDERALDGIVEAMVDPEHLADDIALLALTWPGGATN